MYYNKWKSQQTKDPDEVKGLGRQKVALKVAAFKISSWELKRSRTVRPGGILRWSCSIGLYPDWGGDPILYHVTELSRTEQSHKLVQVTLGRSGWIITMSISWLQLCQDVTTGENQGKGMQDLWVLFLTTAYIATIIKIISLGFWFLVFF